MKTIQQRTPEWFEARKKLITASSVGAILGLDPYRKPKDVLNQLLHDARGLERPEQNNPALSYGTHHESGARWEYEIHTGNSVDECGFFVSEQHPWLGASPDGLIGDHGLLEIKCPFSKRADDLPLFDEVGPTGPLAHYHAQVQIQMLCTGRAWCDFWQWAPRGVHLQRIIRSDRWLAAKLPILKAFYDEFVAALEAGAAPEPQKSPPVPIDSAVARILIDELDFIKEQSEELETRKKNIVEELVRISDSRDADFSGRVLSKITRAGAVKYAEAVKKHLPNLDLKPYTGKPVEYWQVK